MKKLESWQMIVADVYHQVLFSYNNKQIMIRFDKSGKYELSTLENDNKC